MTVAYSAASVACDRSTLDSELHAACLRLRDGPQPPPVLSVPVGHARLDVLGPLLGRLFDRLGRECSVEAKAELVSEWWRVVLFSARHATSPVSR